MKRAILSDIHGNLEALQAVLEDARAQNVEQFYCLGDIVGYGPNPRECVDIVMGFDRVILGNHDQGALYDAEGFSSGAEKAIFWTRQQLEDPGNNPEQTAKRWAFLNELPRTIKEADLLFVHGSARNPLNEYVFPEDSYNLRKLERIFALVPHVCFQGHTHVPGVFTEDGRFLSLEEIQGRYVIGAGKALFNVGSVGQPRDGDPRSCYVILNDNVVEYRRVGYPMEKTMEKILKVPELDPFLAQRLQKGQ